MWSALPFLVLVPLILGMGCAARHRGAPLPRDGGSEWRRGDRRGPLFLKIGLEAGARSLDLRARGRISVLAADGRTQLATLGRGDRFRVVTGPEGLTWSCDDASGSGDVVNLHPEDPDHHIVWKDDPFPGQFRVLLRDGALTLVNIVELEEYLRGVVPWEIGRVGESALAALEAQAVAARTYSVSHLKQREALGFDMWASVMDQVYRGAKGRDKWCDKAIANTSGRVLRYRGREVEAYYCSTCGGVTSNVEEVWARETRPYLRSHADNDGFEDFCKDSAHYRWTSKWTATQLTRTLQNTLPEYLDWLAASPKRGKWAGPAFAPASGTSDPRRPGALRRLEITRRTTSGRVAVLEVETESGVYRVRGDRIRWVLAPQGERFGILRSAFIDLETSTDDAGRLKRIVARGRGFGHGVGLCQTGAIGMARRGYGFQDILKHYYPGAELKGVSER